MSETLLKQSWGLIVVFFLIVLFIALKILKFPSTLNAYTGNAWLADVALMFNMSLLLTFLFQKNATTTNGGVGCARVLKFVGKNMVSQKL